MMEKLFLLFLFFHVSSPEKQSLTISLAGSSGMPDFPESIVTLEVYDNVAGYCDTIKKKVEPKQDWMKTFLKNESLPRQACEYWCFVRQPEIVTESMNLFMPVFNQTGGVHILQGTARLEWDNETGEVFGLIQGGYDGEDVLLFDLETETWVAMKPEVETIAKRLKTKRAIKKDDVIYYTKLFFRVLENYVRLTNGSIMITALPSVSLLQQTPSSPVRCFASGFYPERASLFWRKDGDDLHEDVELGDILPNTDGTFQMSADLKVSSSEDWRRYECVFQLSGVKDDIVTKLDKTAIRTNCEEHKETKDRTVIIVTSVVCPAVFIIAAIGLLIYKLTRAPYIPVNETELQSSCWRGS